MRFYKRLSNIILVLGILFLIGAILTSCENSDKEDLFCGIVISAGHTLNYDEITILRGNEKKKFIVENLSQYPLHSYRCK